MLVSSVCGVYKKVGYDQLRAQLEGTLYSKCHGVIALEQSAHCVLLKELDRFVANVEALVQEVHLMESTIGTQRDLLSKSEITLILVSLLQMPEKVLQNTPMKLLALVRPQFETVWDDSAVLSEV